MLTLKVYYSMESFRSKLVMDIMSQNIVMFIKDCDVNEQEKSPCMSPILCETLF